MTFTQITTGFKLKSGEEMNWRTRFTFFLLSSLIPSTQCYSENCENRNPTCPVCQPYLNELAEHLPFAHCSQSRLYCHISGLPMNENNQPMMLPNGHIYGEQALQQMARENNGQVICPKTKDIFSFKKVEKVFVM